MSLHLKLAAFALLAVFASPAFSAVLFWDPAGSGPPNYSAGNGAWNTTNTLWNDGTNAVSWDNAAPDEAVISNNGNSTIALGEAITTTRIESTSNGTTIIDGPFAITVNNGGDFFEIRENSTGGLLDVRADISISANINVAGKSTGAGAGLLLSGNISGAGGLGMTGSGDIEIAGNNSYTGTTAINGRQVRIGSDTAFGTGRVILGSDVLHFAQGGARTLVNNLETGNINNGGTGLYTFEGDSFLWTGDFSMVGGVVAQNNHIEIETLNTQTEFSGVISEFSHTTRGFVDLTIKGGGTTVFSGNNTYNTQTLVTDGTLIVDGIHSPTGDDPAPSNDPGYVVGGAGSPATLGGIGTINMVNNGMVTIAEQGTLSPGNSIGTFTVNNGDVIFGDSAAFAVEVAGDGSSDLLVVDGDLDLGTLTTLNLSGVFGGMTYTIASYTGTLTGTFNDVTGLDPAYSIDYGSGTNDFVTLVIPEPASVALLLAGAGAVLLRRRSA